MTFDFAVRAGASTQEFADRLGPSAGMRNVLVHAYLDLDMDKSVGEFPPEG